MQACIDIIFHDQVANHTVSIPIRHIMWHMYTPLMLIQIAILSIFVLGGAIAYGAEMASPILVDAIGVPIIDHVNANQKIYISSTISNDTSPSQEFVYIVQVTDHNDTIVLLKWFGGEVDTGQQLDIAVSWTPHAPGTYTVDVFLWDGLYSQNALDVKKFTVISVN